LETKNKDIKESEATVMSNEQQIREMFYDVFSTPPASPEREAKLSKLTFEQKKQLLVYDMELKDNDKDEGTEHLSEKEFKEYSDFKQNMKGNVMLCLKLKEKNPKKYEKFMQQYRQEQSKPQMNLDAFM